jgi:hypothetical protein
MELAAGTFSMSVWETLTIMPVEEQYQLDAYNSLSIEGYRVLNVTAMSGRIFPDFTETAQSSESSYRTVSSLHSTIRTADQGEFSSNFSTTIWD